MLWFLQMPNIMGAAASFFLTVSFVLVLLFLLPNMASSCSIDTFLCTKSDNSSDIRRCGRSRLRCENGSVMFQFFATGQWYPAASIEYPDRTIKIWDTNATLVSRLQSTDCDFCYNFTRNPIPGFRPSWIEDFISNSTFFNCKPDSYNFSRDVFRSRIGSPHCADYDLDYTYQPQKPPPRDPCTPNKTGVVELELLFQEDGKGNVDFSLRSMGFSMLRALDAQCFSCAITDGYCDAVPAARGDSSCACSNSRYKCTSISSTRSKLAIGLMVPVFVLLGSFAGAFILYMKHRKGITNEEVSILGPSVEAFLKMHEPLALRRYKYSELKSITNSFIEKLGEGGYGCVYKGMLPDGVLVAVKVLSNLKGQSGEEFINEVASIGRTNHVNIVSLLGFCYEGQRRALIYEFMCNGSLEKFLFQSGLNTTTTPLLGWDLLYNIAVGIARGLEYLHKGCKTRIVHFDIKPHNILLDEDFCPKISDFGLAKLCPPKESILSMTCARGTIGYIAPEVFSRNFGTVSSKSDVYSYGMMILEMVGRRRNADSQVDKSSEAYFPHWVYDHFEHDEDLATYGITPEAKEVAKKMIIVGLCCIQTNPASRPTISRVVEMLVGSLANLQMPPKPYICSPLRLEPEIPTMSTSSIAF